MSIRCSEEIVAAERDNERKRLKRRNKAAQSIMSVNHIERAGSHTFPQSRDRVGISPTPWSSVDKVHVNACPQCCHRRHLGLDEDSVRGIDGRPGGWRY